MLIKTSGSHLKRMKYNEFIVKNCSYSGLASAVVLALLVVSVPVNAVSADGMEFNRRATATAQILAGIAPNPPEPALRRLVESDAFKEHQQWMTSSWNKVRNRIQTIDAWRGQELRIAGAPKKTLLYP